MSFAEDLNTFFVSCFYSILKAEERAMENITNGALTLKEIHVIEAVFKCKKESKNNFSLVAETLDITLGTLTIYVSKLEKKGYLMKVRDSVDKRNYYIEPTRLGELINEEHSKFHTKMIEGVASALCERDQQHVIVALKQLDAFFKQLN